MLMGCRSHRNDLAIEQDSAYTCHLARALSSSLPHNDALCSGLACAYDGPDSFMHCIPAVAGPETLCYNRPIFRNCLD